MLIADVVQLHQEIANTISLGLMNNFHPRLVVQIYVIYSLCSVRVMTYNQQLTKKHFQICPMCTQDTYQPCWHCQLVRLVVQLYLLRFLLVFAMGWWLLEGNLLKCNENLARFLVTEMAQ